MQRQFRERVTQQFAPLMDALIAKAVGVHHMMARGKDGKWIEVTDPKVMADVLNAGETFHRIYAHDPDAKALGDIFNRVMGMPTQELEVEVKHAPREMSDAELIAEATALLEKVKGDGARVH